jgi:hypothetical protein
MRRALALLFALSVLVVVPPAARAVTSLEGYSSFMTELRSDGGGDPSWQLGNPEFEAELRLKASPWQNVSSLLKFTAKSNRWMENLKDTRFFFREAHLQFRGEHAEAYLFGGQNRFWLNEPLLEIVNQDNVKQDDYGPRAQGIRVDFWDMMGFTGAAFVSEKSDYFTKAVSGLPAGEEDYYPGTTDADTITSSTDDFRAFRLNRRLAADRIVLGATYARKDFIRYSDGFYHGRPGDFDEAAALDAEIAVGDLVPGLSRFGRLTWVTEFGRNSSGWLWNYEAPRPNGFKTELRDIKAGPLRMLGSWEEYGWDFYTPGLANGSRQDLNGHSKYYFEAQYRVPTKAVNLKGWTWQMDPELSRPTDKRLQTEWGAEAYIEFVYGFTGKVQYKMYENKDGTWPNLFYQITGENKLVKLRTEYRIKDIGSDYELTAYGFEANVNLSDSWKFYARVMNVDEQTESRQTAFAQLRYLGWQGAEFFIEYGNPDQSNDLVNDGDFVTHDSGATTDKVFKAFLRIYY